MTTTHRKSRTATAHDWDVSAWIDAPLWNRAQVLQAYGNRSISWLYSEMAAGRLPRPRRIGRNSVAWVSAEVRADIDAKIAAGPVDRQAARVQIQNCGLSGLGVILLIQVWNCRTGCDPGPDSNSTMGFNEGLKHDGNFAISACATHARGHFSLR
jgi:predicted DNA-binding transcriptional regulator AlpA